MRSLQDFFAGRRCVIATMHQKEQAIAPVLETELGLKTCVPTNFDTDQFGTFTRDIQRPGDQLTTARLKAQAAMDQLGLSLAVASEGSFGPHPASPFLSCDREIVLLYDQENSLEVVGEMLTTETNFAGEGVRTVNEALAFASRIGFPACGLIAMIERKSSTPIFKGLTTSDDLIQAVETLLPLSETGVVQVETDMRAMYNPTRMKVIAQATSNLIQRLQSQCPECGYPGFDVIRVHQGLQCSVCGMPTQVARAYIYGCQHCQHQNYVPFPLGIESADPSVCYFCNP